MVVQSALFGSGMYSLAHHHSGVEAVYVVEGEACYESPGLREQQHGHDRLMSTRKYLHAARIRPDSFV